MSACKSLLRSSLCCIECRLHTSNPRAFSSLSFHSVPPFSFSPSFPIRLSFSSLHHRNRVLYGVEAYRRPPRSYVAMSQETSDCVEETRSRQSIMIERAEEACKDTVEELLSSGDDVSRLLKMERRADVTGGGSQCARSSRWFPYLDKFKAGDTYLNSSEVLQALNPHIMETRKERFRNVVRNRSYSVCLVVEGLSDFGNVSAAFRSADALGLQSVHVVSCDSSKRYRDNRHVSMGAEKWLDIELWDSTQDCFSVLKSRGYRIATTHVGTNAVSIYDMDWSLPTAIVVGNENRGISKEALEMSDLHCSIPMKGMVDSFNVSVAAGILMHHAVCDRTARMGCHGDLTKEESQMLLAEFSLRHSKSALSIASEYAKRKPAMFISKL